MTLRKPRSLLPGARIGVFASSSPSTADRIELAAAHLRERGFEVELAPNLYDRVQGYLAADDSTRVTILNEAFSRSDLDAFFFARGGYGAMRILDRLDFTTFAADLRPLIGFSDITALNQAIAVHGCVSFHGPMLNTDFHDGLSPDREDWLWAALRGELPTPWQFDAEQVVSRGASVGTLFGGCLSLTTALMGTPWDYWIDDGIWFWEDVSEPVYRIDRMLTQLRLSGRLERLRGVMIGRLKDCGGADPEQLDSLLNEFFSDRGIPVVRDLPFGHEGDNLLMPIGTRVSLDTMASTFSLVEPVVAR